MTLNDFEWSFYVKFRFYAGISRSLEFFACFFENNCVKMFLFLDGQVETRQTA